MDSQWNEEDAGQCNGDDLALRVYTSRLLGADARLVMHGGGNTSVKVHGRDFFGRELDLLYVKGSGWDLATIEKPGFPALRLEETCMLAELERLSDVDMTRELRALMVDPGAPAPSVEAILHAVIPHRFVDHTHADAVVTLTNNPQGDAIIAELYPDCLILPYVMPGFVLAKQVWVALQEEGLQSYKGIILAHHGVFTFADDARTAYENMIELVTRAEAYISERYAPARDRAASAVDLLALARIRRAVSEQRGEAQLAVLDDSSDAVAFAARPDVAEIATRGPITPDHVIRTKRIPLIVEGEPDSSVSAVAQFARDYEAYFAEHATENLTMLDTAPRIAIWRDHGSIAISSTLKDCRVVSDIARHTRAAIQAGEALGGWDTLSAGEIFELEYWSLEQAKLKKGSGETPAHLGKIALVSGAASGIGYQTCRELAAAGAVVVGLDVDASVVVSLADLGGVGIECDVLDDAAVIAAVNSTVKQFGGLDILVCNAGVFLGQGSVEEMNIADWERVIAINLTATQRLMSVAIPFLRLGVSPAIVVVGSRNVSAPGPGASAYSVSKAGLTQLARVAALELAPEGVRVNVIHPDAVFDTGLWTGEVLASSAQRYGVSVENYKTRNLLGTEIRAVDVARMIAAVASDLFAATTGAQVPVDGGNDRVI